MKNLAILALMAFGAALMFGSCVKIQNKVIMKGDWELVYYKLDTLNQNYMEVVLPSYNNPPGCCKYMIDFQDGDKAIGTYYVNGVVDYTVEGTWSMDKKNKLYVKLDNYVDALFDVDRQNRKNYQLTTDVNTIAFAPGYFLEYPVVLDIKRRD